MKVIALFQNEPRLLIGQGQVDLLRPLRTVPPPRFLTGDVAAIQNPEGLWALSRVDSPRKKWAWPPDPRPGFACPYGAPGSVLSYRVGPMTRKLRVLGVELHRLRRTEPLGYYGMCDDLESAGFKRTIHTSMSAWWDRGFRPRRKNEKFEANPWVWRVRVEHMKFR